MRPWRPGTACRAPAPRASEDLSGACAQPKRQLGGRSAAQKSFVTRRRRRAGQRRAEISEAGSGVQFSKAVSGVCARLLRRADVRERRRRRCAAARARRALRRRAAPAR